MAVGALAWDGAGDRFFETGLDHGVLYVMDANGAYPQGVPWNGLVTVTESPSGAEATRLYADNMNYLNLMSVEEFGATIEAFTYPDEFAECDGSKAAVVGTYLGQQPRKVFGLAYRTKIGNDVAGDALGYKLHLLYGCQVSPSEKAYTTVNDSPEAITFSWELTTTPVATLGYNAVASIVIDSRTATPAKLALLEAQLFGDVAVQSNLPLPIDVVTLMTP